VQSWPTKDALLVRADRSFSQADGRFVSQDPAVTRYPEEMYPNALLA
jgi:hypothetical protein